MPDATIEISRPSSDLPRIVDACRVGYGPVRARIDQAVEVEHAGAVIQEGVLRRIAGKTGTPPNVPRSLIE